MGSYAYGVNNDTSDADVYGWCLPPKEDIFPHLRGEIPGFGVQIKRFEQYQEHGAWDKEGNKIYDLTIYSLVKYCQLCLENNPNMIDSLFVPNHCVIQISPIGQYLRENRRKFLCKRAFHTYKGYSYQQVNKIRIKTPQGIDELKAIEEELKIPKETRLIDAIIEMDKRKILDLSSLKPKQAIKVKGASRFTPTGERLKLALYQRIASIAHQINSYGRKIETEKWK